MNTFKTRHRAGFFAPEKWGSTVNALVVVNTCSFILHWFGASQWQLQNEANYLKLQAMFA